MSFEHFYDEWLSLLKHCLLACLPNIFFIFPFFSRFVSSFFCHNRNKNSLFLTTFSVLFGALYLSFYSHFLSIFFVCFLAVFSIWISIFITKKKLFFHFSWQCFHLKLQYFYFKIQGKFNKYVLFSGAFSGPARNVHKFPFWFGKKDYLFWILMKYFQHKLL